MRCPRMHAPPLLEKGVAKCIEQRFMAAVVIVGLSVVDTVYTAPHRPSELPGGAGKERALRASPPSLAPVKTGTETDWNHCHKSLSYTLLLPAPSGWRAFFCPINRRT